MTTFNDWIRKQAHTHLRPSQRETPIDIEYDETAHAIQTCYNIAQREVIIQTFVAKYQRRGHNPIHIAMGLEHVAAQYARMAAVLHRRSDRLSLCAQLLRDQNETHDDQNPG